MKTKVSVSFTALVLLLLAPAARADGLFYLTGKVGTTSIDANIKSSIDQIIDGNDESAGLGLGFRFGDYLAFELVYQDFGTIEGTASSCAPEDLCLSTAPTFLVEGDTTAMSLTFLPHLPLTDNFFAYGKVGIISWDTSLSGVVPGLETILEEYSDEDVVYGVGARYLLPGPLGVYAEFERFGDTFETVSIGGTLGF